MQDECFFDERERERESHSTRAHTTVKAQARVPPFRMLRSTQDTQIPLTHFTVKSAVTNPRLKRILR